MPLSLSLSRSLYTAASILATLGALMGASQLTFDSELYASEARLNRELDAQRMEMRQRQSIDLEMLNTLHANKRTGDLQFYTLLRRIVEVDLMVLYDQLAANPEDQRLLRRESELLGLIEDANASIAELTSDLAR